MQGIDMKLSGIEKRRVDQKQKKTINKQPFIMEPGKLIIIIICKK